MDFNKSPLKKKDITVADFFNALTERLGVPLERLNHAPMTRKIVERDIHRPGLALAGFTNLFTYQRVQILGNTESRFLNQLPPEKRKEAFANITSYKIPCVCVTDSNEFVPELLEMATKAKIPVFRTTLSTTKFIYIVTDFLDDQFAPYQIFHGSMVDVYGIGIFFAGRSGIGKSEVALDLVERGHRLVADDAVVITRKGESVLMASGTDTIGHFMEIRGLGIIDVEAIFGVRAVRYQKRVEIVVELLEWDNETEYDRTGLEPKTVEILGVPIQHVRLPIYPGKNITVIAEVIALNYLLKHYGYDAAQEMDKRIRDKIASNSKRGKKRRSTRNGEKKRRNHFNDRAIDYFEHDFE
ncbi:MAG: HPr(Ser) kinase/phosphatase [Chloroherpetonaceae bacterium]|nr:HPr(Ser) kinase/phosphatase [Chloroherpetonaceae bacterium]MDW8437691.1 HPr(Ser) kinase/phosphatase [Chloroherpetonaceae bacterium]